MPILRRAVFAAALTLLPAGAAAQATGAAPAQAAAPAADPADVASPEAVVTALYEAIQRAPGERFDWDRMRSLFLPSARMIPNTEQTRGQFRVLTPEEFIQWIDGVTTIGGANDRGFAEEQVASRVEQYGDIAHVFSTYQKHFHDDPRILGRGINSIQLIRHDGRWWVTQIIWDEESGAGPLPERYAPATR